MTDDEAPGVHPQIAETFAQQRWSDARARRTGELGHPPRRSRPRKSQNPMSWGSGTENQTPTTWGPG